MNFADRAPTRKGTLGEQIADRYLIAKGFIPYRPILENVAHPFDRLVASLDKRSIFVSDTKSKAQREFYPDTGIDVRHWLIYKYMMFQHSLDAFLCFVDEKRKQVYGQFLSSLDVKRTVNTRKGVLVYPKTENNQWGEIRYFPLVAMQTIGSLSTDEAMRLQTLSTRNPLYDQQELMF